MSFNFFDFLFCLHASMAINASLKESFVFAVGTLARSCGHQIGAWNKQILMGWQMTRVSTLCFLLIFLFDKTDLVWVVIEIAQDCHQTDISKLINFTYCMSQNRLLTNNVPSHDSVTQVKMKQSTYSFYLCHELTFSVIELTCYQIGHWSFFTASSALLDELSNSRID